VEVVTRALPLQGAPGVYLDQKLREYIHALLVAAFSPKYSARIGTASREHEDEVAESAKASALRASRGYTTPEDIKSVAPAVLCRIVVVPDALKAKFVRSTTSSERSSTKLPFPEPAPRGLRGVSPGTL
jgi:MoxR-like ATPase